MGALSGRGAAFGLCRSKDRFTSFRTFSTFGSSAKPNPAIVHPSMPDLFKRAFCCLVLCTFVAVKSKCRAVSPGNALAQLSYLDAFDVCDYPYTNTVKTCCSKHLPCVVNPCVHRS